MIAGVEWGLWIVAFGATFLSGLYAGAWYQNRLDIKGVEQAFQEVDDYMCPNCVTPWKCNGPHITETGHSF